MSDLRSVTIEMATTSGALLDQIRIDGCAVRNDADMMWAKPRVTSRSDWHKRSEGPPTSVWRSW
ncbi:MULTISPECIES: hypothetical protein [Streptomyces]|uniref:hypothetical protein n=1 Tax=Streptomyces TaxID=1883 RepID=UPI003865092E